MTIEKLEKLYQDCKTAAEASDDERAHSNEDDLREQALRWIAANASNADGIKRVAKLALSTTNLKFARWCA